MLKLKAVKKVGRKELKNLAKKRPKGPDKRFGERLERELPFVVTLITIMAASGISPFGSFMKLAKYKLLPNVMKEARKIVNRVHILGDDPLTAMEQRARDTGSRQYRDLLLGYVSTVRNGGDIADFLQSKMQSIFEFEVAVARQSIAKIGGLVDAYMIMQVISLSMFVVVAALSSLPAGDILPSNLSDPTFSYLLVFVILPGISIAILFVLDKTVSSSLLGSKDVLMKGIYFSVGAMGAFAALMFTGVANQLPLSPTYLFPLLLAAASFWPAYTMVKTERNMKGMDNEMPSYLRDVAESRKAGLSPEKCIIYASERLREPEFQSVVKSFANQLEWGIPMRKIYENLVEKVKSRLALLHFRILVEAIESGGGYTTSLDILAKSSESQFNIELEKKSMMKPYFMIAFMVTALSAVTTLMVSQTFEDVSGNLLTSGAATGPAPATNSDQAFAIGIVVQSWMTGFLIGKMSSGSFSTGFKYSLMLLAISTGAIVATQEFNITPGVLLNTKPPSLP